MSTTDTDVLTGALDCAARGLLVFPATTPVGRGCSCRKPDCTDQGKHPRIKGWQDAATTNEFVIRDFWRKWPDANIGIRTGPEGGLFVVDGDGEAGQATLEAWQLEHGLLPPTPMVKTGGDGTQLYFAYPADVTIPNSVKAIAPGIDVRGKGGLAIAPPSLHRSGNRYAWLEDVATPAPAPGWLLELIAAAADSAKYQEFGHFTAGGDGGPIPEGRRNDALFAIAGRMRYAGLTVDEITAALLRVNRERCNPPLAEDEVASIARSAGRYTAGDAAEDFVKGNGAEDAGDADDEAFGSFGSASNRQKSEKTGHRPWPEMMPLPIILPPAPLMPEAMVPEPFRPWILDNADTTKLPIEMIAAPAIVGAGSVVGRGVGLRPGLYDDFTVVPNLWGAIVARPGWMKTAAVKEAFRPLGKLAAAAHEAFVASEEDIEATRDRLEAEIDALKARMRQEAKKGLDLSALETTLREKKAELRDTKATERRYMTHDATVEKIGELLRDNPRGMLLLRDELSGWLRALDKSGREGDREFFLEAWNGTGSFTTDRIGRGTIHIPSLTLSLFGGIQPGKFAALMSSAIEGGVGDDGLVQRLQLTVWPDRLPAWTKPTRWPDVAARERATAIFATLAETDGGRVHATKDDDIPFLRFSPNAQMVADEWRDALEHRLRSDELDDTPSFAAHISKYRSLLPALALTFFLIDRGAKAPGVMNGAVGESHVRLAIDWCRFLEAHARKLYAVELQGNASAAHALVAKITGGAVFDRQSVRDLYRAQWAGLKTPERVLAALSELTDLGWVRVESESTGGRPSQVVRLHPALLETVKTSDQGTDKTDESHEEAA